MTMMQEKNSRTNFVHFMNIYCRKGNRNLNIIQNMNSCRCCSINVTYCLGASIIVEDKLNPLFDIRYSGFSVV
jgi:hypothetical protein